VAKRKKSFSADQGDLFRQLETPALEALNAPDLDIGPELLGAINLALREARTRGLSRERIVERMNQCLPDRKVTLRQLYAWTANSKEDHPFPAEYLPAFCWAAESIAPLLALAQAVGHDLADAREQAALALGERLVHHARLGREISQLKKTLEG
jgi:hypothetical protein